MYTPTWPVALAPDRRGTHRRRIAAFAWMARRELRQFNG
jgi:hypothetical protein